MPMDDTIDRPLPSKNGHRDPIRKNSFGYAMQKILIPPRYSSVDASLIYGEYHAQYCKSIMVMAMEKNK
jgi:hypothetical protein